jgi:hypothetical protein
LTGGGATALDGIATASIADSDVCHVYAAGKYYYMVFDADATDAESSPNVIRPDDYSTAGVWKIGGSPYGDVQVQPEVVSGLPITGGISGGDVTVSGNTLTITPVTCLDSGLTTKLYTSANATCVIPSVANTDYYVFFVKLAVGGTFEFRPYTTLAAVASDADVSKYRLLTWAQTNGSSTVRPFKHIENHYEFLGNDMPRIAAILTTEFVSKTISTIIPTASGMFESIKLCAVGSATGSLIVSYDGTNAANSTNFSATATNATIDIICADAVYAKDSINNCAVYIRGARVRR